MNKYLDSFTPNSDSARRKSRLKFRARFVLFILGTFIFGMIGDLVVSALRNGIDLTYKPVPELNKLFADSIQNDLQKPFVYRSKIRDVESNYILPDDFHLTVFKLDLKKAGQSLKQLVKLQSNPSRTYDVHGDYADDSYLKMTRTADKIDSISVVNLRFDGSRIENLITNDTLICYYLKFKKFSISYDKNSSNDIWGESVANNTAISIAFLRKQKSLYVMMLFRANNEDKDFRPNLLYSYIRK